MQSDYVVIPSLNDFAEERRSVLHVFRKDLQQVAVLIVVD